MPGVTPLLVLRSGLLGVVPAGLRTSIPSGPHSPSAVSNPRAGRFALLASHGSRRLVVLAAAGELLVDKLPITPDRVENRGLVARVASGALRRGDARLGEGRGGRLALPALAGAGGAYLGSWGGFAARRALGTGTGLPDPVVAVAEDLVAVGLAAVAVRGA